MKLNIIFVIILIAPLAISAQNKPDIRTFNTILPFTNQEDEVTVEVIDGYAVYQGDIILGKMEDIIFRGAVLNNSNWLWSNSTIPYIIGSGFSNQMINEINTAINLLSNATNLCLIPRTTETDYIKFVPNLSCSSNIGRVGGEQIININDISDGNGCFSDGIIHEICHAAGLYHEQSRPDRDSYVIINWANIQSNMAFNFNICNYCNAYGAYDYNSIMHYYSYAFSINNSPTIVKYDGSLISWNSSLTAGDIASINYLYPAECSSANCPSNQNFTTAITSGTFDYEVSGYITASNVISGYANVTYDAAGYVLMNPGFEAQYSTYFKAIIDGCGGQYFGGGGNNSGASDAEQIESQQEMNLAIFPNPASGVVHFSFNSSSSKDSVIRIFDMAGKLIDSIVPNTGDHGRMELDYDTGAFNPGSYIIMLSNEELTESAKLIIIR